MNFSADPNKVFNSLSRESSISRDAHGRWYHEGDLIEHPMITRAFDGWICRAQDGRYCLNNGYDWAYVTIEGPPLFVRSLQIKEDGKISLLLSNDRVFELDEDTLRQAEDGTLYCEIGQMNMPAKFDRFAITQLEPLIDQDQNGVYIRFGSKRVRPPVVDDPLARPLNKISSQGTIFK